MKRRDLAALLALAGWLALLLTFRAAVVEPREWAAACAASAPPLACAPRETVLWLQEFGVWGLAALALGLAGFATAWLPLSLAAIAAGLGGVVDYNASFGMLGLALGAWSWLSPTRLAAPSARGRA